MFKISYSTKRHHNVLKNLGNILKWYNFEQLRLARNVSSMLLKFANEPEKWISELIIPLHWERSRFSKFCNSASNILATCFRFELCKSNSTRFGKYKWFTDVTSICLDLIVSIFEPFRATKFPVQTFPGSYFSN